MSIAEHKPSPTAAYIVSQLQLVKPASCLKPHALASGVFDEVERDLLFDAPVFIAEHDWEGAFNGAQEYGDGTYMLPFDAVFFQFRFVLSVASWCETIDVIVGIFDDGSGLSSTIAYRIGPTWEAFGSFIADEAGGTWTEPIFNGEVPAIDKELGSALLYRTRKQIEAICIGLEAEILESELRSPPAKLVKARQRRGQRVPSEYHVVVLHRRRRASARGESGARGSGVRLHFRRGHYRHFEGGARTWIKWTLVGDPDLGFVDKHYALR